MWEKIKGVNKWFVLCFLLAAGSLTFSLGGCGNTDYQEFADDQVAELVDEVDEKVDAIPFFEKKGKFYDEDASTTVDRDIVLPLLKVLKEIAPTQQWVIPMPEDPKTAFAVYVKLPSDLKVASRMADAVEFADEQFDGLILQQWGHEWLSIMLISKETYEFHKQSRPDIDKQRPDSLRAS